MSCDLEPATPGRVFRLGRRPDPWAYPDWASAGEDGTFGNRFDDPKSSYRVLYASSQRLGAFVEVLARFRPDPAVVAGLAEVQGEEDPHEGLPPGSLPRSWLDDRLLGEGILEGACADIGHSRSLAYLRGRLAARVVHYGLEDLDAAAIRLRAPRRFTQEVSRFVYECSGEAGMRQFDGIRYGSRLGDEFENWAIFEPARPTASSGAPLDPDDPDLLTALVKLGLQLV